MSISLQNTIFVILIIVVILTIVIILTILMLITIKKRHKRPLNISFDFKLSKNSIIFINYISRRDKFKRFNHFFFINQNKFKRLRNFTFIIFSNIF